MKITTFKMPIKIARARARKWWLKSTSIDFIYNANKTKARLIIETNKASNALRQELLMSCLPLTKRGQKLSKLFKEWVASQKVQKSTTKQSYISDQNMREFVESKPDYNHLGGLNQDFGEDARRAGF